MNPLELRKIRTRFAPSPTGYLHVGGARTALFNWLFAKKYGGKFLLRMEDTDVSRSSERNVQRIIDDLQWLGLAWDEDIVFQSKRIPIYQNNVKQLIESGHAYLCFCSPQELENRRKGDKSSRSYIYDRTCLNLSQQEVKDRLAKKLPFAVRFKVPDGTTNWIDAIHKDIKIKNEEIDDFVLQRSDGHPTYQLAVVVDDHEMNISHIIRGNDHIPNTPKQILLYNALGWNIPNFSHVPLILGPDNKRLSKRHGATSIEELREKGYLPEALINYLSLLGWSAGDDKEIMTIKEITEKFSLNGISRKEAVFDEVKLTWMNGLFIREMSDEQILSYLEKYLQTKDSKFAKELTKEYLANVIKLMKNRVKVLSDFVESANYFYQDPKKYDEKGINKYLKEADIIIHIQEFAEQLAKQSKYNEIDIENLLRAFADKKNISAGKIIHPLRLALTGQTASPGLFEMMEILGKETVLRRLNSFLSKVKNI
jgi:glutamyl-tRNA synthetase